MHLHQHIFGNISAVYKCVLERTRRREGARTNREIERNGKSHGTDTKHGVVHLIDWDAPPQAQKKMTKYLYRGRAVRDLASWSPAQSVTPPPCHQLKTCSTTSRGHAGLVDCERSPNNRTTHHSRNRRSHYGLSPGSHKPPLYVIRLTTKRK